MRTKPGNSIEVLKKVNFEKIVFRPLNETVVKLAKINALNL